MSTDGVTRWLLLRVAGSAAVVMLVDQTGATGPASATDLNRAGLGRWFRRARSASTFGGPPVRTVRVVRPADQLDVLVELFDLDLAAGIITPAGPEPALRLTFGAQHVAEEMFDDAVLTVPTSAIAHLAASDSVIVVPVSTATDFTLAAVLDLAAQAMTVQETSGAPDGSATVLELPAGLALSPVTGAVLHAPAAPRTVDDTAEVWRAEVHGPVSASTELRAVHNLSGGQDSFVRIPATIDRDHLVDNTTAGDPIVASQLWLSSSGAFARMKGEWPAGVLTEYRHRIDAGRDIHVEVQSVGYLAPFGHRAAITSIADRIFTEDTGGGQTSVVRLERYVSILDPAVDLGSRAHQLDAGRRNPFLSVVASADETVQIAEAAVDGVDGTAIEGVSDLVRNLDGTDILIEFVATDRDGHQVSFTMPATFLTTDAAHETGPTSPPARFAEAWAAPSRDARRLVDLRGQRVAFSDPPVPGLDQTSKPTHTFAFELAVPDAAATPQDLETGRIPGINPGMAFAEVTDDLVAGVTGTPADAVAVTFHERWLTEGAGAANFDGAFLRLADPRHGQLGGDLPTVSVAAIELTAEVFNTTSGVGPDLADVDAPWDPAAALGGASRLLGSLLLTTLMDLVDAATAVPGIDIPGTEMSIDGDDVTIVYSFKPKLHSSELAGFIAHPDTRCCVVITTRASLSGDSPASVTTEMTVSDFTMVFPPSGLVNIIEIDFARVTATVASDGGLMVDPKMSGWRLGEDLTFLQPLLDTLAALGGLSVDLGSDYLALDASVNLPSMGLGMVAIRNFHLDFGLGLPLQGQPVTLNTGAGSAPDPVEVVVYIFGGSFFTTLDLAFHESQVDWRVEAGVSAFLELGFDAVVVSAAVRLRIALSFVFARSTSGDTTKFTGAISLEGEVSVLGLVEVSVALVASVTYNLTAKKAVAKGTIHWAVETPFGGPDGSVPLGRLTVDLSDDASVAARSLAAPPAARAAAAAPPPSTSSATPSFGDIYSVADWSGYSNAFA